MSIQISVKYKDLRSPAVRITYVSGATLKALISKVAVIPLISFFSTDLTLMTSEGGPFSD